ncbi:MAG: sulfur carrier protein ThiS [Limisphaerales bacterium]|jgi:thiamine biosynthesis protein ThiS
MKKIIYQDLEQETKSENLKEFLEEKKLSDKRVIVEVNGGILEKNLDFNNIKINDGDVINVFLIVSGG